MTPCATGCRFHRLKGLQVQNVQAFKGWPRSNEKASSAGKLKKRAKCIKDILIFLHNAFNGYLRLWDRHCSSYISHLGLFPARRKYSLSFLFSGIWEMIMLQLLNYRSLRSNDPLHSVDCYLGPLGIGLSLGYILCFVRPAMNSFGFFLYLPFLAV